MCSLYLYRVGLRRKEFADMQAMFSGCLSQLDLLQEYQHMPVLRWLLLCMQGTSHSAVATAQAAAIQHLWACRSDASHTRCASFEPKTFVGKDRE